TNWPEWVILQFATARAGVVLVNVNPAYRSQELEYLINQADLTTLFLTDRFKNSDYFSILESICPEIAAPAAPLKAGKCSRLRHVVSIKAARRSGMRSWAEFLAAGDTIAEAELDRRQAQCRPDDVVNIQYTSGTTGFPKGAMLTHQNLLLNAYY